jgi:hypothetical protein
MGAGAYRTCTRYFATALCASVPARLLVVLRPAGLLLDSSFFWWARPTMVKGIGGVAARLWYSRAARGPCACARPACLAGRCEPALSSPPPGRDPVPGIRRLGLPRAHPPNRPRCMLWGVAWRGECVYNAFPPPIVRW